MWDPWTVPLEAMEDVYAILKYCPFYEKWAFCIFPPNGNGTSKKKDMDDKTAHSALLDVLKHEITVNDVQFKQVLPKINPGN